jgi:hypothetical protein
LILLAKFRYAFDAWQPCARRNGLDRAGEKAHARANEATLNLNDKKDRERVGELTPDDEVWNQDARLPDSLSKAGRPSPPTSIL